MKWISKHQWHTICSKKSAGLQDIGKVWLKIADL
jgi:hypothetical protein